MQVERVFYSRSKRKDYRFIYIDRNRLGIIDQQNICSDLRFCINNKRTLLSNKHIIARCLSDNRYAIYRFIEAGYDKDDRLFYALSGFIVGAEGVRSLSHIIAHTLFEFNNFVDRINDNDEDIIELLDYHKEQANLFCQSDNGREIERAIREYMISDEGHDSFLVGYIDRRCAFRNI